LKQYSKYNELFKIENFEIFGRHFGFVIESKTYSYGMKSIYYNKEKELWRFMTSLEGSWFLINLSS
jgi:hypothetical protein